MDLHFERTSHEVECGISHLWHHVVTQMLRIFKHLRLGNLTLYSYHFNISQCQTMLRVICAWSYFTSYYNTMYCPTAQVRKLGAIKATEPTHGEATEKIYAM